MALSGQNVTVKISGAAVAFAQEATTADASLTVFQISNVSMQVWDRTFAITVESSTDGGTTWNVDPATDYTLDRLFGKVIYSAAKAAGTQVRVSGQYLPMTAVAEAHSWSDTGSLNTGDVTPFGSPAKKFIALEADVSGELADFNVIDTFYRDTLAAATAVVLEFDDSVEVARYWALLNKDEVKAQVGSPSDGTVSWQGVQDADGRVMSIG